MQNCNKVLTRKVLFAVRATLIDYTKKVEEKVFSDREFCIDLCKDKDFKDSDDGENVFSPAKRKALPFTQGMQQAARNSMLNSMSAKNYQGGADDRQATELKRSQRLDFLAQPSNKWAQEEQRQLQELEELLQESDVGSFSDSSKSNKHDSIDDMDLSDL